MSHKYRALIIIIIGTIALSACAGAPNPTPLPSPVVANTPASKPISPAPVNTAVVETPAQKSGAPASEVIVYVSDLPNSALYEFDFVNDVNSPGGKMVSTPNTGEELDPPPENDPNVTFKIQIQGGIPYRCWIHMKVGVAKAKSQANLVWVQFSNAVDRTNKEVFKPGTGSYLTAQGPTREGWTWVGCDLASKPSESLVYFRASGEVTVRIQGGMEGVGFDQFLLSPTLYLDKAPAGAIVAK